MNWYKIFYLLSVSDGVKSVFDVFSTIFTTLAIITAVIWIVWTIIGSTENTVYPVDEKGNKLKNSTGDFVKIPNPLNSKGISISRNLFYWMSFFCVLTWVGYVATPTKKDILLIVAGGGTLEFLSQDSLARQLPSEMISFVTTELQSMSQEARVELGIYSQKEKILQEAKKMTTEQLLAKMQVDSNFAKIVLQDE